MILSGENIPLLVLAFVWILGAIMQDLRRREVDNLWNFSLIGFALAYRLAISIYIWDYQFVLNGLIGFVVFIILGNLLYYGRVFAGGDAKLLIALGVILPLSYDWVLNFKIFGSFIFLFLIGGAIYVFIWALVLVFLRFKDFKKEFLKQIRRTKGIFYLSFIFALLWLVISLAFGQPILGILSITIILFPVLLVFAKSVEEACMIKSLPPSKVTEGDWLYKNIRIGNKVIRAHWEGVSRKELKLIQKKYKKKVLVKQGIPFTPGFLIGLIATLIFWVSRGF
jgi:Flp pilus assembly protein protease CpaA